MNTLKRSENQSPEKWFVHPITGENLFLCKNIETWDFENLTEKQQKYVKYNSQFYTPDQPAKASKKPACITAILGTPWNYCNIQPHYMGETINIYENYVELRPVEPNTNTLEKKFDGFTPLEEKTPFERSEKTRIHDDSKNKNTESRIYVQPQSIMHSEKSTRGPILCTSQKSSIRLKKTLANTPGLAIWIDLTFADDVMRGQTFEQRRDRANDCLKAFRRYLHDNLKIKDVWKKEFQDRKSGSLKGLYVPHYHVALSDLSEKQFEDWGFICIKMLDKWVKITGTQDPNALVVALKRKNGKPQSYRIIKNSKTAIAYIGKYFSKTSPVLDECGDETSIGRTWGCSQDIEFPEPHALFLNRDQSIKFRRFLCNYKRLEKNKRGHIGIKEQVQKGWATFLFADDNAILRFLLSIGVDITQVGGVPF